MNPARYYAQRGEDKKIEEILRQINNGRLPWGFYIDVGAWDPNVDSVTKYFYDQAGWNGINIEPVPFYYDRLVQERVRDINLQLAISSAIENDGRSVEEYIRDFTWIKDTGLSTFEEENVRRGSSGRLTEQFPVAVWTLSRVFLRCMTPYQQKRVDFLKIDVEGHEREVLVGNDWERFRPTVLCIEATIPGTDTPAWDTWDEYVISQRYDFVEFDGLNRYYIRQDR